MRPSPSDTRQQESTERRRHVRGLLLIALAALAFAITRAALHGGIHSVFPRGWWHLW